MERFTASSLVMCLCALFAGCVHDPNIYVLSAHNAKTDADMEHAITLRLPLENQPIGATIICESSSVHLFVSKVSDEEVRVRDPDGEVRTIKMPSDGYPRGLPIIWPEGKASMCGLDPASPIGTSAYFLWGEFSLFMFREAGRAIRYRVGHDVLVLSDPLTAEDRQRLRKHSVPEEVARLIP